MQFVVSALAVLALAAGVQESKLVAKPKAAPATSAAEKAPRVAALDKLAVVGASLSAGFGLDPAANPLMGEASGIQLANVVDASIVAQHGSIDNQADFMFFTAPESTAKRGVKHAIEGKATALVALDYLFWLGYGVQSDQARAKELETGLTALEGFKGTILLGDLPDFGKANCDPMMLAPPAIPSPDALEKMNERIAAWAKDKKNVVIVPLAAALAKLLADEEIAFGPNKYPKGSKSKLLQRDNLHTTLEGTCAVWALAADAWMKADKTVPATAFDLDGAKLAAKVASARKAAAPAGAGATGKRTK